MIEFNPASNDHLSALFFGGEFTISEKVPELDENGRIKVFKSGKNEGEIRLKNREKTIKIAGLGVDKKLSRELKKKGFYATDNEVLNKIIDSCAYPLANVAGHLATLIVNIRGLEKQLSTYYLATEELTYPDGCLHPAFIHVQTDTGRLSSKLPNIQNQPDSSESKVKEHFISRFENGVLIQADFSQIEIVIQAMLSEDPQYIKDVNDGVDFHCKRLAFKEGLTYDEVYKKCKEEKDERFLLKRKQTKEFSFQRAYGATANSISKSLSIPVSDIEALERADIALYPKVAKYNIKNQVTVEKNGYYSSFTGKRYYFQRLDKPWYYREYKAKCWYSPTKVKNYIIQGTAADIFLIQLGKLWRNIIQHREKFLLINNIHDSVLIDCRPEYITYCKKIITEKLENVQSMCYNEYRVEIDVPFKIDISQGYNWYTQDK